MGAMRNRLRTAITSGNYGFIARVTCIRFLRKKFHCNIYLAAHTCKVKGQLNALIYATARIIIGLIKICGMDM